MYEGKRGLPLSMNNYSLLLNSCQIPKVGKDEVRKYENSKHIVVMRNGHIYTADVIDKDGKQTLILFIDDKCIMYSFPFYGVIGRLASTRQIHQQLKNIVDETNSPADIPVAILTTTERDDCAKSMEMLRARNPKSLNLIESAIFVLSLDDNEAHTKKEIMEALQFGDGGNRYCT